MSKLLQSLDLTIPPLCASESHRPTVINPQKFRVGCFRFIKAARGKEPLTHGMKLVVETNLHESLRGNGWKRDDVTEPESTDSHLPVHQHRQQPVAELGEFLVLLVIAGDFLEEALHRVFKRK